MPLPQPGTAFEHDLAASGGPLAPSDRIAAIDIVRGIALFGVMAINVVTEFRVSIFAQFLPTRGDAPWLDWAVHAALMVGIDSKAFALFSLLFGAGLAIQYERLAASSSRTALLVRRLAILMLIGGAHLTLVWNGDILLEYAIAGLVVLAFLRASAQSLAIAGLAFLAVFVLAPFLPSMASLPSRSWMTAHVAEATRIYSSGGFIEVLALRIREIPAILPLHVIMFPRTVALMLIGAAAWRAGLFRNGPSAHRHLPTIAVAGILAGGALGAALASGWLRTGWMASLSLDRLGVVLLACGYGAAIVWAASKARARTLLAWAAPLGRMTLTSYLAQSVIFGWIFYGYGLGLFGELGVAAAFAIGIAVYVAQAVLSAISLQRYRHGPVEWLWRSAMYGTRQPFLVA